MEMDEKTIMDIAEQLGISGGTVDKGKTAAKTDPDVDRNIGALVTEIIKIKEMLKKEDIPYGRQAEILKSLVQAMDGTQKARLEKIAGLLGS